MHQEPTSEAGITQQVATLLKSMVLLLLMPSSLLGAKRWWSDHPCNRHSGKPSSLPFGVVNGRWVCKSCDCCPGSSLEHLQLTKLFPELSSLAAWCGCTSFKEKVELSPYCPQRWP